MSITITDARLARGYSGYDHLLDDQPLSAIIGRSYASLEAAAKAAGRALRGTQDSRCASTPVILTDSEGNGWVRWPGC
jgi:hypothetical protein